MLQCEGVPVGGRRVLVAGVGVAPAVVVIVVCGLPSGQYHAAERNYGHVASTVVTNNRHFLLNYCQKSLLPKVVSVCRLQLVLHVDDVRGRSGESGVGRGGCGAG